MAALPIPAMGLVMATALGAGHADLGYVSGSFGGAIRNYPDVVRDENEIPPLLFAFNVGAIIVNKNGLRFVNEAQSYKVLSGICMTQLDGIGFQIFDEKVMSGSLAGSEWPKRINRGERLQAFVNTSK